MRRRITQPSVPLALQLPNLLSVEEVAASIHRHPEVVRRQARDGRLPGEKIGRVWFFRPEGLAEAGFSQFLPRIAGEPAAGNEAVAPPANALVSALAEAGLQAHQRLDRDSIFSAVGLRLADAGVSTYFFLLAPDHKGLTVAYWHTIQSPSEVAKLTGHQEIGSYLAFDRVPILHRVCATLRPEYIGDHDELVGRVAMAMRPSEAANARQLSALLQLNTAISAPLVVGDQVVGAMTVLGPELKMSDLAAVMAFANHTAAALETARLLDESRQMEEATVLTLAGAVELRDALHSRANEHAALAERLAEHVGFDPAHRRRVRYAALLQDLGKLTLPDSILRHRGRLDTEERALMMTHPVVAADLLRRFKPLEDLALFVRSHHEWFNGEGYPDGLKGEAIPIETRILSVVNAFFNVTFDLPVKTATTVAEGLLELTRFEGINLDPGLTEAFVRMCRDAESSQAPWFQQMLEALKSSEPPPPAGPRDILSVADSRELRIIYRIAQETTAVLDLDTLLSRIVAIIREVMGYYMVSILLPTEKAGELRVGAQSGYAVDITGLTIPVDQGITGWVYTRGLAQIIQDVKAESRYIGLDDQVRSELAFPLISRGHVVGVLNAESQQADAFSEADVALMSAVGSQLASSLEVAQLHDSLKREASHDPLTRLNNRRLFLERIQQQISLATAGGESFSILFLDVDQLKKVNDTYGHLGGDALLREVSNALLDAVRGEDVVARYGGDEFVVLLPATGAPAAVIVAQRVSDGIARHRFMAGRDLLQIPGVSLGVATFPQDGATAEELLAAADATLYRQKRLATKAS
ncbi:MAG TPA: diguanylate cyclase [Candidatus Dormibacteraeota bacterium]|nr:diguanylate cyclase [Candidatus Dormibacteraeota bacterium]